MQADAIVPPTHPAWDNVDKKAENKLYHARLSPGTILVQEED